MKSKSLTAIDLFSGCGGLTEGLRQARFDVLAAVEIENIAAQVYKKNHRKVVMFEQDISTLSPRKLMKKVGLKKGELDLLAGCPPCQGFSSLRTRNGAKRNRDQRNLLVKQIVRYAKALKPRAVMLENVPMLAQNNLFKAIVQDLTDLKYQVIYKVADAADFGVPQRRKRLIMLATLGFAPSFDKPRSRIVTVRDAIGKMPRPGVSGDSLHRSDMSRRSDRVLEIIRKIPKNGGSRKSLPEELQLDCHKRKPGFNDVYGRMAWDKVSPTITGGCYNPSKGRFLHPTQDRPITLREAAMLQGFKKSYYFDASLSQQATALMIGNALPPPLIKHHAKSIARQLEQK
ncbi:MAG: DNA cytosine methyltransferase [Alphaproteobacteria bacterium]|nr:DNA cytosine methyltransferase [Alphaproteobacteria bacterium]